MVEHSHGKRKVSPPHISCGLYIPLPINYSTSLGTCSFCQVLQITHIEVYFDCHGRRGEKCEVLEHCCHLQFFFSHELKNHEVLAFYDQFACVKPHIKNNAKGSRLNSLQLW